MLGILGINIYVKDTNIKYLQNKIQQLIANVLVFMDTTLRLISTWFQWDLW